LAEDIALAGGVGGFEGVAGGDGAAEIAGIEKRDGETVGIEGWEAGIGAAGAGIGAGRRAAGSEGDDGVGDAVAGAVVEAANGAGIVNDAVRLAALDDGQAGDGPAVGQATAHGSELKEFGELVEIGEVDDVLAVEIGEAVAATEVGGVVAIVEEAHGALFVGGVGEGVGEARLEAMTYAFFHVDLKGVVGRDARGGVGLGFGGIADVGNAKVDVAAFVVGHHGGAVGKAHEAAAGGCAAGIAGGRVGAGGWVQSGIAAGRCEDGVAVGVGLAVDGVAGSGDAGLVEGDGNDFVAAEVADVADGDG